MQKHHNVLQVHHIQSGPCGFLCLIILCASFDCIHSRSYIWCFWSSSVLTCTPALAAEVRMAEECDRRKRVQVWQFKRKKYCSVTLTTTHQLQHYTVGHARTYGTKSHEVSENSQLSKTKWFAHFQESTRNNNKKKEISYKGVSSGININIITSLTQNRHYDHKNSISEMKRKLECRKSYYSELTWKGRCLGKFSAAWFVYMAGKGQSVSS